MQRLLLYSLFFYQVGPTEIEILVCSETFFLVVGETRFPGETYADTGKTSNRHRTALSLVQESNPGPFCCDAGVLTTHPPYFLQKKLS